MSSQFWQQRTKFTDITWTEPLTECRYVNFICLWVFFFLNIDTQRFQFCNGCCWTFIPAVHLSVSSVSVAIGVWMHLALLITSAMTGRWRLYWCTIRLRWWVCHPKIRYMCLMTSTELVSVGQIRHSIPGKNKAYSHIPLGAPGGRLAIAWEFPPPGIIRLGMAWPEGWSRAKM